MNTTILDPDERCEMEEALRDAWHASEGGTATDRADAMLAILRDAQQAHRTWPTVLMDEIVRAALARRVAAWGKGHLRTTVGVESDDEQRTVSRAAVYGVRREGRHGRQWTQARIDSMGREDIEQLAHMTAAQVGSLRINQTAFNRVQQLLDAHPQAETVSAALTLAGVSLDDWMAREAAA